MSEHRLRDRIKGVLADRRTMLAIKGGLAAGLAWYVGALLPEKYAEYAYYASLGAVSVIYPVISDAVEQALRATAAIFAGTFLAILMQVIAWPNALSMGVLILVSAAVGNLRVFGAQRNWVVTASLFVLVFSGDPPLDYALVYICQILIGVAIGLVVNFLLFPSLNLVALEAACERLRTEVVTQMRAMEAMLRSDQEADAGDYDAGFEKLERDRDALRLSMDTTIRSGVGNPRSHRWRTSRAELTSRSEGLERVAFLVQDMGSVLRDHQGIDGHFLDRPLQHATSSAFVAIADLIEEPTTDHVREVTAQVEAMVDQVDATTFDDPQSRMLAGLMAVSAQRCLRDVTDWLVVRQSDPPSD